MTTTTAPPTLLINNTKFGRMSLMFNLEQVGFLLCTHVGKAKQQEMHTISLLLECGTGGCWKV